MIKSNFSGFFNFEDRLNVASLRERLVRSQVLSGNIANAETPGFRALGYDFEEQLQTLAESSKNHGLKVTNPLHKQNEFTQADGTINPDVYVRPTESVGQDGNTVDLDVEMAQLAQNQLIYRGTIESINRKIGMLKYAIQGGR